MELFDKKFVRIFWDDELEDKECIFADSSQSLVERVNTHEAMGIAFKPCAEDGCIELCPFGGTIGGHKDVFTFCYYDPLYDYKLAYKQGKKVEVLGFIGISRAWVEVTDDWKWEENYQYRVKSEMWTAAFNDEGVISVIHSSDWNKSKGRQLIEGTERNCECFATENYCNKCAHKAACFYQQCTMKIDAWYCQGFRELKQVKKRLMTNRELAKWVWQGNGQVKHRDGYYTLIACTAYDIRDDNKPCPDYYVIRGWDETEWHEPEVEVEE